jgi:1-acyl-sn-glycerol-3-phosphate acyltransferase
VLRFFVVLLVIVPATLYHGARVIWGAYRGTPGAGDVCDRAPREWAALILRAAGASVVLENPEAIDPARPQIVVANHVSWFDVLALLAHTPGRSLFVAKRELERVPVFGRAITACGHILIDRDDRNRAVQSLGVARELLEKQSPTIIMFPEGTRSATGALQPFKKGAFVLAIQAGVDVVPAAIFGSREIMRKGSLKIRAGTVRVRFGEPIPVEGLTMEDRNELTERAWRALAGLQSTHAG